KYTWARVENRAARVVRQERIPHARGAFGAFLSKCEAGSPVAVETVGNWYWVVDEVERAGGAPQLVNARLAKAMMGQFNKSDKLDTRGLNLLQRTGTLPTVWIPSAEMRDARELPRTRMALVGQRTQLKNRVHATLAKYGLTPPALSDLFGKAGRIALSALSKQLPPHTAQALGTVLTQLDGLEQAIVSIEKEIAAHFHPTPEVELLRTLPGVGPILSVVIQAEMGDVNRFLSHECFASYAGTTPRLQASGGKSYSGRTRP
ncbi:MAG: IS110 family transposase, partial [Xanthomonadales bacterium]|nr:IS110 family transposase [Xanthomonadales bacterium]NIO15228.1 IS110 family transposase [Xanthomonadales bacterium]NIR03622.1 IS110 family transposase [Gemmatimonadales bacterium]